MQGSQTHAKQIQKAIEKQVRQVIAASEIKTSTRSGSKELTHLIKRLANQPVASLAAAAQLGEALGYRVIAVSQKMGRSHLDQGVIRQLVRLKQVPDWGAIEPESRAGVNTAAQSEASIVEAAVIEEVSEPVSEVAQLVEGMVAAPTLIELPPVPEVDEIETTALEQNVLDEELDEEDLDEEDSDEEELDEEDLGEVDSDEEELDEEELDEEELDKADLAPESLHDGEDLSEETPEELDEQTDGESTIAADLNEISSLEVESTPEVEATDTAEAEATEAMVLK